MERWKSFFFRLPIYLVLSAVVGIGLWNYFKQIKLPEQLQAVLPTEPSPAEQGIPPEKLVDNIIGIGETVPVYDEEFTGHLELTVTEARFVTSPTDCPKEWMYEYATLYAPPEEADDSTYDHWFLPNGPLGRGAKLVRLEVSITNVDAVAKVQVGNEFDANNVTGFFYEDDFFPHNFLIHLTDLSEMDADGNLRRFQVEGHSDVGKFVLEDNPNTIGTDNMALKIPLAQTVQVSMIFPVSTKDNGTARNPGYLFGVVKGKEIDAPRTYIDLNLEDMP